MISYENDVIQIIIFHVNCYESNYKNGCPCLFIFAHLTNSLAKSLPKLIKIYARS